MKGTRLALTYRRLRKEPGSAWVLLALEHAPVALGILQAHLGGRESRLPSSVLHERLREELVDLRGQGVDLPQTAEQYLAQWLRAGYLVRRFPPGAAEEEYELSTAAVQALRFVQGLEGQRAVATESRLSLVIQQLRQLAEQTETDPQSRLDVLLRERERLDAEIEAVRTGRVETLPPDRAMERVREVTALARELVSDFRRVRDEFARINRELREQIVENEGSRGEVLDKVFAGVDLIAESEAGRTFRAFWRLLTDPEQSSEFEEALERVLSRDFSHELEPAERRFLLRLTGALLDNGGEVHDVIQQFARGLRQFVQSQAYREQRRLHGLLRVAQRRARELVGEVQPTTDIGMTLYLSSAGLDSLARWRLHDPSGDQATTGIERAGEMTLSLETVSELVAQSEIDFRSLREQVDRLLAGTPQVSVAEVLEAFPAEQGLGSVVGLLAMAAREGLQGEARDRVCWTGRDGVERCAWIPRLYFVSEPHAGTG
ncbi:MAG: DUF3375 domain-containing protein [Gammaproteobacteria bacterium]|nr:MAG: DUF3375 domain-containing protein [Gammaproteobacteria bacterium]